MSLTIKGVQGWVYFGGRRLYRTQSWTMNQTAGVQDVTDFHSSGVEREYTGVVDVTGSVTANYDIYDTSTGGKDSKILDITQMFESGGTLASGVLKLIESTKSMWSGTVLFTDFGKSAPAAGGQTITLNWAANGRMKHTSNTSTATT